MFLCLARRLPSGAGSILRSEIGIADTDGSYFVSRRSIYRMPQKLFRRKMRTSHLLTRLTDKIESGMMAPPVYWEAVQEFPMFSIVRKKVDPKPMRTPEDRLIDIVLKRQPHLGDAPHAFASGLSRYYVHPVQAFVSKWKQQMALGFSEEEAYERVQIDQWRTSLLEKIEHDVQARQAAAFGVPAPNIGEQLEAIDRDMYQATRNGVLNLERLRFERLNLIAARKMVMIDLRKKIDRLSEETGSSKLAVFNDIADHNFFDIEQREALRAILFPDLSKGKPETTKPLRWFLKIAPWTPYCSVPPHEGSEGDQLAMSPLEAQLVYGEEPITYQDVRVFMTDDQFTRWKASEWGENVSEAFDPVLWETDTHFAESVSHGLEVERLKLSDPSAAGLRARQHTHLHDLIKLFPYLGSKQTDPSNPTDTDDVAHVEKLIDMMKLMKTTPDLMKSEQHPQPTDFVNYNQVDVRPQPKTSSSSSSTTTTTTAAAAKKKKTSEDFDIVDAHAEIDMEAGKAMIVNHLEKVRKELIKYQQIQARAASFVEKTKPNKQPSNPPPSSTNDE